MPGKKECGLRLWLNDITWSYKHSLLFFPYPANVLSFSQQKACSMKCSSPLRSSKIFSILIKNISQQICVMSDVLSLSHHQSMLKAPPGELSIDYVLQLQRQVNISRWLTMKRIAVEKFMAGVSVKPKGKGELQYSANQIRSLQLTVKLQEHKTTFMIMVDPLLDKTI